jgi:iron only hydrogenase large subunit-like protein
VRSSVCWYAPRCSTGKVCFTELENKLHDTISIGCSPLFTIGAALLLAEKFRLKPSVNASGVLKAVLSKLGFDRVFESAFGTEVFIMEEAALLLQRIRNNEYLPVISSACPAWVSFAETEFPDLLPYLSTCRSPQQMASTLAKCILQRMKP